MKSYKLTLQKPKMCVASCIQAILRYEGEEISQEDIYNSLEKDEKDFAYISGEIIKKFFIQRKLIYEPYKYNKTPFNEPDSLLNEMKNMNKHGIIGVNSHAYLFLDFKDPELELANPKSGKVEKRDLVELLCEMRLRESGWFGLIKRFP